MRFLMSMIDDESLMEEVTPEQMEEIVAQMNAYNDELKKAGVWSDAEGLGPTAFAKTLRYGKDGKAVITDGPFTESKEQVAGYWIIECKDIDEAVQWAQKVPIETGSLEVRPIPGSVDANVEAYKDAAKK
jgi:hypothetical protein